MKDIKMGMVLIVTLHFIFHKDSHLFPSIFFASILKEREDLKKDLNKACDVYQLTVEHLRNAGPDALDPHSGE